MADKKISQLPASTTPLAGTEVLPIVQSGTTKQVAVSNLTTGRSVSVGSLTSAGLIEIQASSTFPTTGLFLRAADAQLKIIGGASGVNIAAASGASSYGTFGSTGLAFPVGLGIDFSATSEGTGTMTSELLADYEEGTWTGTLTAATPPTTPPTATGMYTKVGRQVTVYIEFVAVNTSGAAGAIYITGLPYAAPLGGTYKAIGPVAKYAMGTSVSVAVIAPGTPTTIDVVDANDTTQSAISAGVGRYLFVSLTYTV